MATKNTKKHKGGVLTMDLAMGDSCLTPGAIWALTRGRNVARAAYIDVVLR